MKILLIRPPYTRLKGLGPSPYFPLGLGYIASILNENNFEANIYHCENLRLKNETMIHDPSVGFYFRSLGYQRYLENLKNDNHFIWKEVEETLNIYRPDMVGISVLSAEVASALKISQIIKKYREKCYVVWGGVHPTFLPAECLKNKEIDFVIRGEGEYAMLNLCQALKNKNSLFGVKGLSFKNNGEIVHNSRNELIENIDKIPLPARSNILYPEMFDFRSFGSMILTRGCPYRCTFCSSRIFWEKRTRFRSPINVINEIKMLQKNYGTTYFMFWDDSFTINKNMIEKYCYPIIESKLKISWKTSTRADLIDESILKLMKKAGCVNLEIGVESGSDRIKKIIHKDVTNIQIKKAFDLIRKNNIGAGAFFMAGFPEETARDLEETFQFIKELEYDEISFNIFDPMPGSEEYEKCVKFGLVPINPDWNNFPLWPDAHFVRDISKEDFNKYVELMASWVYEKNNSFKYRFRRSKNLLYSLLKNDPGLLIRKIIKNIKPAKNKSLRAEH